VPRLQRQAPQGLQLGRNRLQGFGLLPQRLAFDRKRHDARNRRNHEVGRDLVVLVLLERLLVVVLNDDVFILELDVDLAFVVRLLVNREGRRGVLMAAPAVD
jgi:hypothetical protein